MNLPKDIPAGVRRTVEEIKQALDGQHFAIVKAEQDGETVFLLCSVEPGGKGEPRKIRQLCELADYNALKSGQDFQMRRSDDANGAPFAHFKSQ